jgi:hypothetical protein
MTKLAILSALVLAAVLPSAVEAQPFWQDNFDAYATGSPIAGQGGWEAWDNNPAFNTIVTNATVLSPPNALLVGGPANVIRPFGGNGAPTGDLHVKVFIPSNQTGEVWLRIPNTYVPGGTVNWSVRMVMCVSACTSPGAVPGRIVNIGGSEVPGMGSTNLVTDQWVEIHVIYNVPPFGNNYAIAYGGSFFTPFQPMTVTAPAVFKAVNLFSNNSSATYMDDSLIVLFIPVELMTFSVD